MKTKRICIVFDPDWDEYSFNSGDGSEAQRYRTPDKDDAVDTCRAVYGRDVVITHRRAVSA